MAWRECPWHISFFCLELHRGSRNRSCPGGCPCTGAVPEKEWAVSGVYPMALVRGVCSAWRSLLSLGLRQTVGLEARGGRTLPQRCHGAEGSARCVCHGRLPSHISRRRSRFLGPIVTRCLQRADKAQKSSIYIRPLEVVSQRGVGHCKTMRRVCRTMSGPGGVCSLLDLER
jgi:hypothetical protein